MSAAQIRVAAAADVGRLAALRRAWLEEYVARPIDDEHFERDFADWYDSESARRTTWLATVDGDDVGMLNMTEFRRMPQPGMPRRCWGYIANAFVLAEHRDGGVGAKLLDAALQHASRRGYARLVLSPSPRSVPFYRRAGFVPADSLLVLELG